MNDSNRKKILKIRRVSRVLSIIFMIIMTVSILLTLISPLIFYSTSREVRIYTLEENRIRIDDEEAAVEDIGGVHNLPLFAIFGFFLIAGIIIKGLWHISRLFALYARGKIFTRKTVNQIRKLGYMILALMVLTVGFSIYSSFQMGMNLSFALLTLLKDSALPITFLLLGVVIVTISWVMDEGRKLNEEYELTI